MTKLSQWLLDMDANSLLVNQRATHTHVIGQPGTGKSRALESWIIQAIAAGQGVGVIDPHGDLFQNLLVRISSMPKVWERVVIIDPCNSKWVVSFNPLAAIQGFSQERLSLFLTDVMIKIWSLDTSSTPRLIWLLTNSFLALANLGLSLLDLPRFLLDNTYRDNLLPQLSHEGGQTFFRYEFPSSRAAIHQWVTPVLNKLGSLIFDPDLRLMLAGKTKLDFREVLDRNLILLVNLPKGILGEGPSALLAAFIVAHIQKAALSRANTNVRNPFYLYLDEFQNYTTDNIKDILSKSRKYALSLTLAHQYLDQLSPEMRSAVLNTAGTLVSFRVGYQDASRLAKEIFPSPDFLSNSNLKFKLNHIGTLPFLTFEENQKPFGWDGLAQVLTRLPHREFWARRRGAHVPARHRTFDMPVPKLTNQIRMKIQEMQNISGQHFGKPKLEVQQEIDQARKSNVSDDVFYSTDIGFSPGEANPAFWSN